MQKRRRALISVGASVMLLTAGCSAPDQPATNQPATDQMSRFLQQDIAFGPCDAQATATAPPSEATERSECGRLDVPLDCENPSGEVAEIAVLRVPATGNDRIGSVVVNPGGPGSGGTWMAPLLASTWTTTEITERFDLIGFDPRGVGASTPTIDCYSDTERENDAPLFTPMWGEDWTETRARDLVAQCAESSGGANVLAHVGTRDAVRDMDLLRHVLGEEKLNFAGTSYGTRLGAVYAEMFPDNVRALVLDGALDPSADKQTFRVTNFAGMQAAFDAMVDSCIEQAACPLGSDRAVALDVYLDLVRTLDDDPASTGTGRDLDTVQAMDAVFSGLYSAALWPVVIAGLQQLQVGDGTILLALRDSFQGRAEDGTYANSAEASVAINCMDDNRLFGDEVAAYDRAVLDAAPFMDPGHPAGTTDICAAWPEPDPVRLDADDISDALPAALVISATRDPATPYQNGVALADILGAALLTVDGDQHGTIVTSNACIEQAVGNYLIELELPAHGSRCTL